MKYKIIIVAFIVASFIASFMQTTYAQAPDVPFKEKPIKEQVEYWANYYKIDSVKMMKVIKCESGFNPKAIHIDDGGKGKHSVGLLQFQESTFNTYAEKLGKDLDYYDASDQIELASYMWFLKQQNQWSCYSRI